MVQCPVDLGAQNAERVLDIFQGMAGGLDGDIRFQLPDNPTGILAAIDGAIVDAGGEKTGLAAADAAHIVAQMRLAVGAGIGAALDDTAGIAADAAGILKDDGGRDDAVDDADRTGTGDHGRTAASHLPDFIIVGIG